MTRCGFQGEVGPHFRTVLHGVTCLGEKLKVMDEVNREALRDLVDPLDRVGLASRPYIRLRRARRAIQAAKSLQNRGFSKASMPLKQL